VFNTTFKNISAATFVVEIGVFYRVHLAINGVQTHNLSGDKQ
jgi:hypothetical protein